MKMVELDKARRDGLYFYFTGKPCKRGHIANRRTKTRRCVDCRSVERLEYRVKTRDRRRQYKANYRSKNWPALRATEKANRRNRRARVRAIEGKHTKEDIAAILKAQKGRCAYCRCKVVEICVDHIIPMARGGSNWPSNVQVTCRDCNQRKHVKDPIEFAQMNGMLL